MYRTESAKILIPTLTVPLVLSWTDARVQLSGILTARGTLGKSAGEPKLVMWMCLDINVLLQCPREAEEDFVTVQIAVCSCFSVDSFPRLKPPVVRVGVRGHETIL